MTASRLRPPRHRCPLGRGRRGRRRGWPRPGGPTTSRVVRNGSRGMLWLEPLVEVETAGGARRLRPGHARRRRRARSTPGCSTAATTRCGSGSSTSFAWLRDQQRSRSPGSASSTRSRSTTTAPTAAWSACAARSTMDPADVVAEVTESGLRGRGGAGFPAGIKWQTVLDEAGRSDVKYVCCNADEGDSGTFADRMLIEGDPFTPHRGHARSPRTRSARPRATSTSARSTPTAAEVLRTAIDIAYASGLLGDVRARLRPLLRPPRADGRRRLHLRRGDLDARQPRGQARRDPGQAADPRARGPVRPADRGQQRAHAGQRAR